MCNEPLFLLGLWGVCQMQPEGCLKGFKADPVRIACFQWKTPAIQQNPAFLTCSWFKFFQGQPLGQQSQSPLFLKSYFRCLRAYSAIATQGGLTISLSKMATHPDDLFKVIRVCFALYQAVFVSKAGNGVSPFDIFAKYILCRESMRQFLWEWHTSPTDRTHT